MSRIRSGAGDRDARPTRDRLYDAAAALFVERGYDNTTMADIAGRADTSRRTAFNHFPSKGDIPMMWTRRMADRAVDVMCAPSDDTVPERIRRYFRQISELVEAEPELTRQMMLGWTAVGGPLRYESQLLVDLAPMLHDARARGEVDPAVDVDEATRTLSDVYMGVVFRWVREQNTTRSLREIAEGGIDLVLRALPPRR